MSPGGRIGRLGRPASESRNRSEPLILLQREIGPSLFDTVVAACRNAGFEPRLAQPAPQSASIVHLVAAELGVSLVPASARQLQLPAPWLDQLTLARDSSRGKPGVDALFCTRKRPGLTPHERLNAMLKAVSDR